VLGRPIKVGAVNERIKLQRLSDRRLFHDREIELRDRHDGREDTCPGNPKGLPASGAQQFPLRPAPRTCGVKPFPGVAHLGLRIEYLYIITDY